MGPGATLIQIHLRRALHPILLPRPLIRTLPPQFLLDLSAFDACACSSCLLLLCHVGVEGRDGGIDEFVGRILRMLAPLRTRPPLLLHGLRHQCLPLLLQLLGNGHFQQGLGYGFVGLGWLGLPHDHCRRPLLLLHPRITTILLKQILFLFYILGSLASFLLIFRECPCTFIIIFVFTNPIEEAPSSILRIFE